MVMTPFEICFSKGMLLRIKNRYVPTVSVLQIFLQTVTSLWSVDHFLALEIGWVGVCKHVLTVSKDVDANVFCFN